MKVFTWASTSVVDSASGRRYRRDRSFSKNHELGLLFGNDDGKPLTGADREAIAKDLKVSLVMRRKFVMSEDEGRIFVSRTDGWLPLPDSSTAEDLPLYYVDNGVITPFHPRKRFDECMELVRELGCSHCPFKGEQCYRRMVPNMALEDPVYQGHDEEWMMQMLRNRKTKIAGFTYISPTLTKSDENNANFFPSMRGIDFHDFTQISKWSEQRSTATKHVQASLRFKKGECTTCPVSGSCKNYTRCDGPLPELGHLIQLEVEKFDILIEASPMPAWQLWAIARAGGKEAHINRKRVALAGLAISQGKLFPVVNRVKCSHEQIGNFGSWTYMALAEKFGLPVEEQPGEMFKEWHGRPDDLTIALYHQCIQERWIRPPGKTSRDIMSYQITPHGILMPLSRNGKHLYWADVTVRSFDSFYDTFRMPNNVKQSHVRQKYEP